MITSTYLDTTLTRTLQQMFIWPQKNGQTNVLGKVVWKVEFELNGATTEGMIESLIDVSDLSSNFLDISEVTEEMALQWALDARGGNSFIEHLYQAHYPFLKQRESEIGLVPWELNSNNAG